MIKITPNIYSKENLEWLIKEAGFMGVVHFLLQIDGTINQTSPILKKIFINAHVYK